MAGSYEDRDGKIWMDGELIDWRDAHKAQVDSLRLDLGT